MSNEERYSMLERANEEAAEAKQRVKEVHAVLATLQRENAELKRELELFKLIARRLASD